MMGNFEDWMIEIFEEISSREPLSRLSGEEKIKAEIRKLDRIGAIVLKAKSQIENNYPYTGPARDGIEAQHGLNDIYPGDPYNCGNQKSKGE